jgi:YD repeat-containing protein
LIANALNQWTVMAYDQNGNMTNLVDALLRTNCWLYDTNGRQYRAIYADGSSNSMGYDAIGRLAAVTNHGSGLYLSYSYDNLDRMTDVTFPDGTGNHFQYSCCGLDWTSDRLGRVTSYGRDALRRTTSVTSPLGFFATKTYNQFNQVVNSTDFAGNSTAYEYYPNGVLGAGQLKCQTQSGKKAYCSYTARGESSRTWGDVPYPAEYIYSDYGELVELHTFRGGTGWNGSSWPTSPGSYDKTTWMYEPRSGMLTNKTDDAGRSVTYTYINNTLSTRSWARSVGTNLVTVTNTYNDYDDLVAQEYNDGTPNVYFNKVQD